MSMHNYAHNFSPVTTSPIINIHMLTHVRRNIHKGAHDVTHIYVESVGYMYKACRNIDYTLVHTRTQAHLDKQVMNLNADELLDEGCCRLSI